MPETHTTKIAVVTGGASGIGLAIAERLAAGWARIVNTIPPGYVTGQIIGVNGGGNT